MVRSPRIPVPLRLDAGGGAHGRGMRNRLMAEVRRHDEQIPAAEGYGIATQVNTEPILVVTMPGKLALLVRRSIASFMSTGSRGYDARHSLSSSS